MGGIALLQDLKKTPVLAIPYKTKLGKEERAHQASGVLEARKVILPANAPWLAEFINEVVAFPHGKYDDQVDSMTQFLCWFRDNKTSKRDRPIVGPILISSWERVELGSARGGGSGSNEPNDGF